MLEFGIHSLGLLLPSPGLGLENRKSYVPDTGCCVGWLTYMSSGLSDAATEYTLEPLEELT